MAFDDIPEDKEQSFPCPEECSGNVVLINGEWECDNCDWSADDTHKSGVE